jgi:hypothetical protein
LCDLPVRVTSAEAHILDARWETARQIYNAVLAQDPRAGTGSVRAAGLAGSAAPARKRRLDRHVRDSPALGALPTGCCSITLFLLVGVPPRSAWTSMSRRGWPPWPLRRLTHVRSGSEAARGSSGTASWTPWRVCADTGHRLAVRQRRMVRPQPRVHHQPQGSGHCLYAEQPDVCRPAGPPEGEG